MATRQQQPARAAGPRQLQGERRLAGRKVCAINATGVNRGGRKDACHLLPDLKLPNCDPGREARAEAEGPATLSQTMLGEDACQGKTLSPGPPLFPAQRGSTATTPHRSVSAGPLGPGTTSGPQSCKTEDPGRWGVRLPRPGGGQQTCPSRRPRPPASDPDLPTDQAGSQGEGSPRGPAV